MTGTNVRWEVEWSELTAKATKQREENPHHDHNPDEDEVTLAKVFATQKAAKSYARKIVNSGVTTYGYATVVKQELQQIEGTIYMDWEDVGEVEHID